MTSHRTLALALLAIPVVGITIGAAGTPAATAAASSSPATQIVRIGQPQPLQVQTLVGTGTPSSEVSIRSGLLEDLTVLASDSATPLNELKNRYVDLPKFERFESWIRASFPKQFLDVGYDTSLDNTIYVRMKGTVPPSVLTQARELPYSVRVESGALLNEAETKALTEKVTATIASTGKFELDVSPDPTTGEIVANIGAATTGTEVLQAVAALLRASVPAALNPGIVLVANQGLHTSTEQLVRGGARLDRTNGAFQCTSGFGARIGSTWGVLTAAHCDDYLLYNGNTGVVAFEKDAGFIGSGTDGKIDIQFHRTLSGNSTRGDFQYGPGATQLRSVTDRANAAVGTPVCHFGYGTNAQACSTVEQRNTCYGSNDYYVVCGVTRTKAKVSEGGDSGGPWYTDSTARGIHSGSLQAGGLDSQGGIDPDGASYFAPQTQVGEGLGGAILTTADF